MPNNHDDQPELQYFIANHSKENMGVCEHIDMGNVICLYPETVWDARLPVNQCGAHRDRVLSYQNRTYCFQMRIIFFSFSLESFPTDIIQIESLTHNLSDCLGDKDSCT